MVCFKRLSRQVRMTKKSGRNTALLEGVGGREGGAGSHMGNESQRCSIIYSRVGIVLWDLKLLHLRGERLLRKEYKTMNTNTKYEISYDCERLFQMRKEIPINCKF